MRKLTLALGLAVALCGVLAGARPASATVLYQIQTLTIPAGGGTLTFNQFSLNPSWLLTATWDTHVTLGGTSQLTNNTGGTKTVTTSQWRANGDVTVMDADTLDTLASASVSQSFWPTNVSFTNGQVRTGSVNQSADGQNIYTNGVDDVTRFIGAGTLDVDVTAVATKIVPTLTGWSDVTDLGAGGTVKLTYQYDDGVVPEPSTIALLGLGCLGLIRRKRAKKQA